MYIRRLLLKNYRCFGPIAQTVTFADSGLTALIGPNNAGKSTILQALDILLGDRWPSGRFSEEDFHNNVLTEPIMLACEFAQPMSVPYYSTTRIAKGLVLSARHLDSGFGESSVDIEFLLLGAIHDFDNMQWDALSTTKGNPIRVSQEIKNGLPVVVTVPLIKLAREQPSNKWGVLGRMMQKVERRFSGDAVAEESFKTKIHEAVDILRSPEDFQNLESDLKHLWEDMKPSNLGNTSLEFLDFEPWRYYRQFRLAIRKGTQDVPIDTLGEGVQRLAVLALYRAYLKRHGRSQRAILLIEEPESYLHPQARATVFRVLREAIADDADTEGQIIYTTHSEDFIDCGDFEDVVVFGQDEASVSMRRVTAAEAEQHALALNHFDGPITTASVHYRLLETSTLGLKEALFAHKAIIVEGQTETELLGLLTETQRSQVAVVSAGGKSNIPAVLAFLSGFGVPCMVVIDRDNDNARDNEKIAEALSQSNAALPDATAIAVTKEEIEAVPDGQVWSRGRLIVLGKNVESVLQGRLPNYPALVTALRTALGIPATSKPRTMRALCLAHNGEIEDAAVVQQMETARQPLRQLISELGVALEVGVGVPELLTARPVHNQVP